MGLFSTGYNYYHTTYGAVQYWVQLLSYNIWGCSVLGTDYHTTYGAVQYWVQPIIQHMGLFSTGYRLSYNIWGCSIQSAAIIQHMGLSNTGWMTEASGSWWNALSQDTWHLLGQGSEGEKPEQGFLKALIASGTLEGNATNTIQEVPQTELYTSIMLECNLKYWIVWLYLQMGPHTVLLCTVSQWELVQGHEDTYLMSV